jgi:hypothetical protein
VPRAERERGQLCREGAAVATAHALARRPGDDGAGGRQIAEGAEVGAAAQAGEEVGRGRLERGAVASAREEDVLEIEGGGMAVALRVGGERGAQRRVVGLGRRVQLLEDGAHLLGETAPHDHVALLEPDGPRLAHQHLLLDPVAERGAQRLRRGRSARRVGVALEQASRALAADLEHGGAGVARAVGAAQRGVGDEEGRAERQEEQQRLLGLQTGEEAPHLAIRAR